MRSYANPAQSYVVASPTATSQQTVAMQGCDGNTYYLAPANSATVQSAIAGQNVVQLNTAPQGSAATASGVMCLIQAGQ